MRMNGKHFLLLSPEIFPSKVDLVTSPGLFQISKLLRLSVLTWNIFANYPPQDTHTSMMIHV